MEPTLRDGDWLLVDPDAYSTAAPHPGDLAVARDPRLDGRLVVKRVKSVEADGAIVLAGDHAAHREDDLRVTSADVRGRPWFRYWPLRGFGRVR